MCLVIQGRKGVRENEKEVQESWPSRLSKDFTASFLATDLSSNTNTSISPILRGRCLCWALSVIQVQPDPRKLHSSSDCANWLLVNFCLREALSRDRGRRVVNNQVIVLSFLLYPPPHLCLLWLLLRPALLVPSRCLVPGVWQQSFLLPEFPQLVSVGRSSLLLLLISALTHQPIWPFTFSNTSQLALTSIPSIELAGVGSVTLTGP